MEVSLRQNRRYNVEIKAVELGTKCSVNFFADTIALFALISKPTNQPLHSNYSIQDFTVQFQNHSKSNISIPMHWLELTTYMVIVALCSSFVASTLNVLGVFHTLAMF